MTRIGNILFFMLVFLNVESSYCKASRSAHCNRHIHFEDTRGAHLHCRVAQHGVGTGLKLERMTSAMFKLPVVPFSPLSGQSYPAEGTFESCNLHKWMKPFQKLFVIVMEALNLLVVLALHERVLDLLATVNGRDEDEKGAAGDEEAERSG
jgi:hypothetical protein